jgi:hypothetical protein
MLFDKKKERKSRYKNNGIKIAYPLSGGAK